MQQLSCPQLPEIQLHVLERLGADRNGAGDAENEAPAFAVQTEDLESLWRRIDQPDVAYFGSPDGGPRFRRPAWYPYLLAVAPDEGPPAKQNPRQRFPPNRVPTWSMNSSTSGGPVSVRELLHPARLASADDRVPPAHRCARLSRELFP